MPITSLLRAVLAAGALIPPPLPAASDRPGGGSAVERRRIERQIVSRRSSLVSVEQGAADTVDGHRMYSARLRAQSGLVVDLLVKRPVADTVGVQRPVVVLLGGHRTGRRAAALIPETRGAVVAALSYPYGGTSRASGVRIVREVPAIRRAVHDTPPAVMLALDYLLADPAVDPAAVEGVGVSLGVPFMTVAAAIDPRIGRVWAIHGSAGAYEPLEHNLRARVPSGALRRAIARFATRAISGEALAPERWVGRIAPRPFVMVSAVDDRQMPRPLVDRLYESAGSPKSITWLPGGHVRADPAIARGLVSLVLDRMEQEPVGRAAAAPVPPAPRAGEDAR